MWRSVLVVIVLSALTSAQSMGMSPQSESAKGTHTEASPPSYSTNTYFNGIRQGTTQKAVLAVSLGQGFVASPKSQEHGLIPAKLQMESNGDLDVSQIEYPPSYRRQFTFRPDAVDVIGARFIIQFKMRARKNASVGEHTLCGSLVFQTIGDDGTSYEQRMEIRFPVRIVPHDQSVMPIQGPPLNLSGFESAHPDSKRDKLILIAMAPILIPLSILLFVVCGITGQDCRC